MGEFNTLEVRERKGPCFASPAMQQTCKAFRESVFIWREGKGEARENRKRKRGRRGMGRK